MKQSQNAITFLRAQYSAIYGRAYIKGLASAMVVTSAFVGAYSQEAGAIEVSGGDSWDPPKDYDTGSNQAQAQDNLGDGYYRNLTVQSGDTLGIRDIFLSGELNIKEGGTASLTGTSGVGRDLYGWNNVIGGQTSDAATGSLINNGTFNIGGDGQTDPSVKSSHAHFKDILLGSGSNTFIRGIVDSSQSIDDYSTLAGGYAGGNVAVESGTTIYLKNNAQFKVAKGSSGSFDGVINLYVNRNGVNGFIRGEDNYDGSGWTSGIAAKLIFGEHSVIRVSDSDNDFNTHGMGGIYAAGTELHGKIAIQNKASLTLDGDFINTSTDAGSAGHGAGNFVAGDTALFVIEKDSRLIVGDGAYANNPDTTDVDESKLKTSLDLTKVQSGNLSGEGALEVRGSLALTESVLKSFVVQNTTGTVESGGSIVLNNGILDIISDDPNTAINLDNYFIRNHEHPKVDIAVVGTDNTIKADNLSFSKKIAAGQVSANLTLEADKLTMGGGADTNFGIKKTVVHDKVNFITPTNSNFLLNHDLLINAVGNGDAILGSDDTASSKGDVYVKKFYQVVGGGVTHEGSFVISDGAAKVGGATDTSDASNTSFIESAIGHDASLTLVGGGKEPFRLTRGSLTIEGNGYGATSLVDISQLAPDQVEFTTGDASKPKIEIGTNTYAADIAPKLSDAVLQINDQQLGKMFGVSHGVRLNNNVNGTHLVIGQYGTLKITDHNPAVHTYTGVSNNQASTDQVLLDVSLLRNGDQNTPDSNFIYFQNGGRIEADKLQLRQDLSTNVGRSAQLVLDIGHGTLAANELQIRNADPNNEDKLEVSNGILEVGSKLSGHGKTQTLVLGDLNTSASEGGAHLNLGHLAYTANADASGLHDGTYAYDDDATHNPQNGTISTAIVLNGATAADASLNVKLGTWQFVDSGSLSFGTGGHGTINIGMSADEVLDPNLDPSTLTAELKLSAPDGLSVTSGNAFNILDTGISTFTKFIVDSGASSLIDGVLNVNEADFSAAGVSFSGHGRINIGGVADSSGAAVTSGSLAISQANLRNFLTPADPTNHPDIHGTLLFKEDGTLDFSADTTLVNIGSYSFAEQAANGSLTADVNIAAGKQLEVKASDLLIDQALAENAVKLTTNSTNLTLGGGSGFISSGTALGLQELKAQNVTFVRDSGTSNAFTLHDKLSLSAPPTSTGATSFGTVSGDVVIADGGTYHAQEGTYTHRNGMTLGGGTLQVGGTADLSGDASLRVNGDFFVDNRSGSSTVNITGNESGGAATLDLSHITNLTVNPNSNGNIFTSFNVGDSTSTDAASLKIKGTHLGSLLGSGAAGVLLNASGQMDVSGDVVLKNNVFASGAKAVADQIVFNNGGKVTISGTATLANSDGNQQALTFGLGRVDIKGGLKLSGGNSTFAQGTLDIGSVNNKLLQGDGTNRIFTVGDGTTAGDAIVNFYSSTNNTLDAGLTLNGNGVNSAKVTFDKGTFTAQDITVSGGQNTIELGDDDTSTAAVQLSGGKLIVNTSGLLTLKGNDADSGAHGASFTDVSLGSGAQLNLNLGSLTISGGSGDFSKGTLAGTANVQVIGNDALASLQGENFNDLLSSGARFTLQSGADLDLKSNDFVDITKYTYDTSATGTGNIHVIDSSGDHISQITGDMLHVSKNFAQNGATINLGVTATDLKLGGGSGFNSSITALGLDSLNAQNVTFVQDANSVNAFTLQDQLNLTAPETADGNTGIGLSKGPVNIASGGTYHLQQGDYTHEGKMTLNGGSLQIGGDTTGLLGDASLKVSGAFGIDNRTASSTVTVKANGSGAATLDLLQVSSINVKPNSNGGIFTTFDIGDSGTGTNAYFNVKGEHLSSLLGSGAAGVLLNASSQMVVSGDVILKNDVFAAGTSAAVDQIVFNSGGHVTISGQATLNNANASTSAMAFGSGSVEITNGLKLSGGNAALAQGTLDISSSTNKLLQGDGTDRIFTVGGDGTTVGDAIVNFQAGSTAANNSLEADLALKGNSNNNAKVTFDQGTFKVQDISISGSGNTIDLGDADVSNSGAQIIGDKLELADNGSLILQGNDVDRDAHGATFNNITLGSGANLNLNLGFLTISGGSGDFSQGSLTGKADINVIGSDALASLQGTDFTSLHDSGAKFSLQDGADLKLEGSSLINLSQYTYDDSLAGSSDFHVVGNDTDISKITGDNLAIYKALTQDNTPIALDVHAVNLTLGGGASFVSSEKALGLNSMNAQNVTFRLDNGTNYDFALKDLLNLSATVTGNSSGDVILADSGIYHVQQGAYTHSDDMTLNGGSLLIGGTDGLSDTASLIVNGKFAIDNNNGYGAVTVKANALGGNATLDLTNVTDLTVSGTGLTKFAIGDSGASTNAYFKVNGGHLSNLLGSGAAGVLLNASGQMDVSGDVTLKNNAFVSGTDAAVDQIVFNEGGKVNISGSATLANGDGNDQAMAFGSGTVSISDGLILSGGNASLAQGTLGIGSINNQLLQGDSADRIFTIGDGKTSGNATVNFSGNNTDSSKNVLEADLALNGSGDNEVKVTFDQGSFTAQDITVSGTNNSILLGDASSTNTDVTLSGKDLTLAADGSLTLKGTDTDNSGHSAIFENVTLNSGAGLTLNIDSLTISGGVGNFSDGNLAGSADLIVIGNEASASLKGENFNDLLSGGADFTLQSGADLNLKSDAFIDITQYDYDTDGNSGRIHVIDSSDNHVSQITGDKLTVSKSFIQNGATIRLGVTATDLKLGGGNNFVSSTTALGLDSLNAKNVIFINDNSGAGSTFTLQDTLNLSALPDDAGNVGSGTSTNGVIIAGGGSYNVLQGDYIHTGSMTLGGGTLQIGNIATLSGDAALSVSGDFTIDNSTASSTVIVKANGSGAATLDISNATLDVTAGTGSSFTNFDIGDAGANTNAYFNVSGDHLSKLLGSGAAGILLNASGQLNVSGNATLDVGSLVAGTSTTTSAEVDKIIFNGGGVVDINGTATLTNTNNQAMHFGSGTVSVQDGLILSGGNDAVLAQGTLTVGSKGSQLLQGSSNFQVGDSSTSGDAIVNFKSDAASTDLSAGLSLKGNGDNNAVVSFNQGTFNAQNINVSGDSNIIKLGDEDATNSGAQLIGGDLELAASGALTLQGNAADRDAHGATFDNILLGSGSTLTLDLGSLTISGGSGDFSEGTLTGKANINVIGADALASLKGDDFTALHTSGAKFSLQDGADLNLKGNTSIDIAQYEYDDDLCKWSEMNFSDLLLCHIPWHQSIKDFGRDCP